ncbi:hypothetical protein SeLEV6574_g07910 [Synchytrium endobioticum]|uniref:Uncharacterized protein n=1 Tax=Synchytrium endobioticum TaxID=286115 RepID=A0A507CI85_9FUNG|nr:hypothetical protein SeLEV6574_g07910 [Synchytrium endobioticum]
MESHMILVGATDEWAARSIGNSTHTSHNDDHVVHGTCSNRQFIDDYVTALIDTGSDQSFFNDAALFQSIVHRDARFNTIIGHDDELVAGTGPVSRVLAERLAVHIKSAYYVPSASTNILAYADVAMEYPALLQYGRMDVHLPDKGGDDHTSMTQVQSCNPMAQDMGSTSSTCMPTHY